MTRTSSFALAAVALLVSACGMSRSAYETPQPVAPVQPSWTQPGPTPAIRTSAEAWWSQFDDPALDALVLAVLDQNQDLAAAGLRLRQARTQADFAESRQLPVLSGEAGASASRAFENGPTVRSHDVNAGLSYELDLWGRLGAQTDAAGWAATATEEDLAATRLALIGSTVDLYFQLAALNERLVLADLNLEAARRRQVLVQARYAAGTESGLAIEETRSTLLSLETAVSELMQQRVETRNSLGLLLGSGHGASPVAEPTSVSKRLVPAPDPSVPAAVLARRPDLRAAEARLKSTLAEADATRAGFYPAFTLTSAAGGTSESLQNLFTNPVGSVALALSLPFLDAAGMQLTNAAARAGYEAERLTFQQTLVTALAEVENALSRSRELATRAALLEQGLDAARRSEQINDVRYRAGEIALRDLLDSQDRRRAAEAAVVDNGLARLSAVVDANLALGMDGP